jgi:phenylpropionate dioxygenase-like ring-hydroxylating dioxygenase large terminal subunit
MTTLLVTNCWYVIASTEDVGVTPVRRTIMDDAVTLYRTTAGVPVALRDRCAHCGAPLSAGTVAGDAITCPYHGLVYDATGACINVPSQAHVPDGIQVRSFPTYEDGTFVWIWPGNPDAAKLAPPPHVPLIGDPSLSGFGGTMLVEADYVLLHEHLLDITHYWVGLAESSPATMEELTPLSEVEVTETRVAYHRTHRPAELVEWEAQATGLDPSGHFTHRDSATFVSPGLQLMTWDIESGDGTVFRHQIIRALTPESSRRTRVAWLIAHDYADRRPQAIHVLRTVVADTLRQDVAMVEMVQANLDPAVSATSTGRRAGRVSVLADAAALKATQIIRNLVARES